MMGGRHAGAAGAFGEAPYGTAKRVRGVPECRAADMRAMQVGAFGGALNGAARRARGAPKWRAGVRNAGGLVGAFSGTSYWGHATCEAVPNHWSPPCGRCRWGFRQSRLRGHEACKGRAEMSGGRLAGGAVGAFGGAFPWGHATRQGVLK